jgi:hypothetical protein
LRSSQRSAGVKDNEVGSGGRDSPTLGPTIGKARGLDDWGSGDEKLTIKPDGQISNALSEYLPQYCKDLLHVVSRNDRTLPGEV